MAMALALRVNFMIVRSANVLTRHYNFTRQKQTLVAIQRDWGWRTPSRTCSTEQKIQEKIRNQQKIRQVKPPTKEVPKTIVRLLLKSHGREKPCLSRFTRLARAFGQAKFKVNDLEAALRQELINKKDREAGMHGSLATLRTCLQSPLGSPERVEATEKLFQFLEDSRNPDPTLSPADHKLQSKKIDFLCCLLRFASLCDNSVMHYDQVELERLDAFVRRCYLKFDDPSPLILFWMSLFQKETFDSLKYATALADEFQDIKSHLLDDLENFADEYNKHIDDTPSHLLFQTIPRPFVVGNIPSFVDKLSVTRVIDSDDFIYRAICFKSRALWNAAKFSKSLPTLAIACEFWLANLESRNDLDALGQDLLLTLSDYIKFSIENDYEPALKFFKVFGDKMESVNPVPIVKFFFYIFGQGNEKYREESIGLLDQYPVLRKMWDKKLEKKLLDPNSTIEGKKSALLQMAKKVPERLQFLRSQNDQAKSNEVEEIVNLSPNIVRDMLDVKILSMIKDGKVELALDSIQQGGSGGHFPSNEALLMLIQYLFQQKDISGLEKLRSCLPDKNDISDRVYGYELTILLRDLHEKWENGSKPEVVDKVISHYKQTLEEEYRLQFEFLDTLLIKTQRYIRFFLDDAIEVDDLELLGQFEKHCKDVANIYEDFSLLAMYWEANFFSKKYNFKGRDLLNENPKLSRQLDIDSALIQAQRLAKESIFRDIVEITLRFDLDNYQKCKALEGLLLFQCKDFNKRGATATVNYASSLDIELSPEMMRLYHVLPDESQKKGLIGKLSSFIHKE